MSDLPATALIQRRLRVAWGLLSCQVAADLVPRGADHESSAVSDSGPGPSDGGQVLLDVRYPLACRAHGGRRRQRLHRRTLVLPGHAGMHRTMDVTSPRAG